MSNIEKVSIGDFVKSYKITNQSVEVFRSRGFSDCLLEKLEDIKNKEITGKQNFINMIEKILQGEDDIYSKKELILNEAGFVKRIINSFNRKTLNIKRKLVYILLKIKNRDGFYLKDIQGSKMLLNIGDKGISNELLFNDIREVAATKYMYNVAKKGDIILDIGANIGYYALLESRLVGDKGKVYAIEPEPRNIDLLKRNVSINDYKNIEIFHSAVGDKNGTEKLYVSSKSNWHSMVTFDEQGTEETIDVNILTVDTFLKDKEYPALIRMDVEGYEYNIIKGMKDTLTKEKPLKLFIEIHPQIMKEVDVVFLLTTLKQNNFEVAMVAKRNMSYNYNLDYLLHNKAILNGSRGAFQIYFERE